MPNIITADETKGIPPLEGDYFQWVGQDGPMLAEMATEIFIHLLHVRTEAEHSDVIKNCVRTAADILKETALYMNSENKKTSDVLEEHTRKHARIIRVNSADIIQ